MIVTCPACNRKYRVEEDLVKSPYQKMRCSYCGHTFIHGRDREAARDPEFQGQPEIAPSQIPKKRRKGLVTIVIALLVVAALAVAGYYYWANYMGAGNRWLHIKKLEGQETITKDGRVFLISGVVSNDSTKARQYVIMRAKLFDEQGATIGEHLALAGLLLSAEEVREMRRSDIEVRVAEFRQSSLPTFTLRSGNEMPFSVVFPGTYSARPKQFSVEIVESPFL
jgi:predicted Zn finger-like uncharacterized protein